MVGNNQKPWFKVKSHGLGAYPVSWQGWLCLLFFLAIFIASVIWLLNLDQIKFLDVLAAIAVFVLTLGMLIWIAWKKSDQPWKWRWEKKK